MCTVIFIPESDGYILSSVRDEQLQRPKASPPTQIMQQGKVLLYPTDVKAGGSWIVMSNDGTASVLFNGAFEKHTVQAPYLKSRGIVLLDLVHEDCFLTAWNKYTLTGVEPFSVIHTNGSFLWRFVWNGNEKLMQRLNHEQPRIWSSATLYNSTQAIKRENVFREWLAQHRHLPTIEELEMFLHTAMPDDTATRFIMKRSNRLASVSYTTCTRIQAKGQMRYIDLLSQQVCTIDMQLQKVSAV